MVIGEGKYSIYLLCHLDQKSLRILIWEDDPGFSGGLSVITRVFFRVLEGGVVMEAEVRKREIGRCYADGSEDGGRATNHGLQTASRSWKRQGILS